MEQGGGAGRWSDMAVEQGGGATWRCYLHVTRLLVRVSKGVLLQLQLVFRRLDEGHEPTRLVVLVTEVDRVLGRETR